MKIWICPGSFDPVTAGHLDIIKRAAGMCDKLIVAIGVNDKKQPFFPTEDRRNFLKKATEHLSNVEIDVFSGLLVHYAEKVGAVAVVKGLRAVSDFEYELQMALLNKRLKEDMETVFLMTNINYSFLSSRAVRELAANDGDIEGLVPDAVLDDIRNKFRKGD
ncbi:MAG TPA: pantetheine-phosphate adenylyltransferase [Clostridia bacterium]|nr:pantetheine-phosphate adenylyltransferase [Clostridia bacterium]HPQ47036.1 pantetheine-phosphate adenylyltransferase [Clostridia bacterium]HRX42618.1 pantetheine-phosphate adenylyltransferase [Clostridia bacterium]